MAGKITFVNFFCEEYLVGCEWSYRTHAAGEAPDEKLKIDEMKPN